MILIAIICSVCANENLFVNASGITLRTFIDQINKTTNSNIVVAKEIEDQTISVKMNDTSDKIIAFVCEQFNFAYRNGIIRKNIQSTRIHSIGFLINETKSSNTIELSSSINSKSKGSLSKVSNKSHINFWQEFENALSIIVGKDGKYSINKQAGILVAICDEITHAKIDEFIFKIRKSINRNIQIDAQIIEINLKKSVGGGIEWRNIVGGAGYTAIDSNNLFKIKTNIDLPGVLSLLKEHAQVRTIARPSILVLNNHTAIFKSAKNEVYFTSSKSTSGDITKGFKVETITSKSNSIPIGITILVSASVDEEDNIVLEFRPVISIVVGYRQDPSLNTESKVPITHAKEMSTIISLKPNQTIIIGGLRENDSRYNSSGLPVVGSIPILGALFGSKQTKSKAKTEVAILLTAKIID